MRVHTVMIVGSALALASYGCIPLEGECGDAETCESGSSDQGGGGSGTGGTSPGPGPGPDEGVGGSGGAGGSGGGPASSGCLDSDLQDVLWANEDLCPNGLDPSCVIFNKAFMSDGTYWEHTLQLSVSPCADGHWSCTSSGSVLLTFCDGATEEIAPTRAGDKLRIGERDYFANTSGFDAVTQAILDNGNSICSNGSHGFCVWF